MRTNFDAKSHRVLQQTRTVVPVLDVDTDCFLADVIVDNSASIDVRLYTFILSLTPWHFNVAHVCAIAIGLRPQNVVGTAIEADSNDVITRAGTRSST